MHTTFCVFETVQNFVNKIPEQKFVFLDFQPEQVGSLFTFLARQSARQESRLQLTPSLKHQVVDYLTSPEGQTADHEERQQVKDYSACHLHERYIYHAHKLNISGAFRLS